MATNATAHTVDNRSRSTPLFRMVTSVPELDGVERISARNQWGRKPAAGTEEEGPEKTNEGK